jgi:hypothetical protein
MTTQYKEHLLIRHFTESRSSTPQTDITVGTRICKLKYTSLEEVVTEISSMKHSIQRDLLGVLKALPLEIHGEYLSRWYTLSRSGPR